MDRIIIAISNLSKKNWTVIYRFIKNITYGANHESKKASFLGLQEISEGLRLNTNLPEKNTSDVYSLYGEEISVEKITVLPNNTCFSIIYQKEDDAEDLTELVPFVLLQHEFGNMISLGIDVQKIDIEKRNRYKFKCSDFFILYDLIKPKIGSRSIYFIENKLNKETGEILRQYVASLAGKREDGISTYFGNPSRRFIPLIKITEKNYTSIFGNKDDDKSLELRYMEDSIDKIKKDWEGKKNLKTLSSTLKQIFNPTETTFGRWLESGYFYSYDDDLKNLKPDEIQGIRNTLQIFKTSVVELVQNIVFHGGKEGLVYCMFEKKSNIAEKYRESIPDFGKYDDGARFLRIGVFDFGNLGIVDTFKTNIKIPEASLSLRDFFDKDSIVTTGLTHLDMRYAARLGIKTFVKTIIGNKGFFRVESNEYDDGVKGKKQLQTVLKNNIITFDVEENVDFVNGTHYEIVLPVKASDNNSNKILPLQRASLHADSYRQSFVYLSREKPLYALSLPVQEISLIANSVSKEEQIKKIKNVGLKIINESFLLNEQKNADEIVLDLKSNDNITPSLLFKIVAFLQLNSKQGFEKTILINTTDLFVKEFFSWIDKIITGRSAYPVWSRDAAIIIISENMHARVVWGETKDELIYINKEFQKFYCNDFFVEQTDGYCDIIDLSTKHDLLQENCEIDEFAKKKAYRYILPYDIMIHSDIIGGISLFEYFINKLLRRKIGPKDLGFLVNHENTYIGNKIIVKNYYEADMMFQNNFFTERFAYLITHNIRHELDSRNIKKKKLVIIGYNQYSEVLLKAIRNSLKEKDVYLAILKEKKDEFINNTYFDFDIDNRGSGEITKNKILKQSDRFFFITIVPIGATLSTNDKIIALFKQWLKSNGSKLLKNESFIYNHCVIVVRDATSLEKATIQEKEQKWTGIDLKRRIINTSYNNAKEIHYTVQIGRTTAKNDEDCFNWARRLNDTISFPKKWWEERYVNFTENSSVNSQNLMGFPEAEICEEIIHEKELNRFFDLQEDIYKGHIDVLNCHHKYYIDTEKFVKRRKDLLDEWLKKSVREKGDFNQNHLNVIITPNVERESDLVFEVNNFVFDGNALIVYLDVNNWRNNMVHKLSFLKDLHKNRVRYHYVDQGLLTGETYHKTKSYLISIVGDKKTSFASIITIVNRLSFDKLQEIKHDVNFNLFAFVNLHYPAIRPYLQDCELCKLTEYYDNLHNRTVLDSCLGAINKNLSKIKIIQKNDIDRKKISKRNFLRLVLTHELYYRIAEIIQQNSDEHSFEQLYQIVEEELNGIYEQFSKDFQKKPPKSRINEKINNWMLPKLHNVSPDTKKVLKGAFCSKLKIDKKISFLKVISSPPLSQYIAVRNYAHEKLLNELHVVISKVNDREYIFEYDDLKTVKSILKSLSFLKSNALVRKDVIIGVWRVLGKVIENIDTEKKELIHLLRLVSSHIKDLNKKIQQTRQSQQVMFEESVMSLKNERKQAKIFAYELYHDLNYMDIGLMISDFSRDFQFFIKNAIVEDDAKATFLGELLRRGKEMSDFGTISICKTILSLKNDNDNKNSNDLFALFNTDDSFKDDSLFKIFKKEYTNFLVWLFYDNTTIIRKTLDNFSNELSKDKECFNLFYHRIKGKGLLNGITVFKNKLDSIKTVFKEKVEKEYYYSSFKPYLQNGDEIDYVQKLLYVVYAKLKLNDLTMNKHKSNIETDITGILEILSAIVGADAAFMTIKTEGRPYPISSFGKLGKQARGWDYGNWIFDEKYYSNIIYNYYVKTPLIIKYNISDSKIHYGEETDLNMKSIGIFSITGPESGNKITAAITFLYNGNNSMADNETVFRIGFQESGRLLLLLKKEINEYVINFLIKDKVFDLWMEKNVNSRRFEKAYSESAHTFRKMYDEMQEFENLNNEAIYALANTWFFLTNETVNFIYSNIEKNSRKFVPNGKHMPRHWLSLFPNFVIEEENTLGKTFNSKYVYILSSLLDKRWNSDDEDVKNTISINGKDIKDLN